MTSVSAPDAHAPYLRTLLQVLPAELSAVLPLELVVERLGVVIVDQYETLSGRQGVVGVEDELVTAGRWLAADVELWVSGRHGVLLDRVGHAGEPVHQHVDALSLLRVVGAQGRVRAAGKPAGGLGLTGAAKLSERVDQQRGERGYWLGLDGVVSHSQIVFTLLM